MNSKTHVTRLFRDVDEIAALFAALGDPTRLKIVRLLSNYTPGSGLCVNALANIIGASQSAISQHLRILKDKALVRCQRRGMYVHCWLDLDRLKQSSDVVRMILGKQSRSGNKTCARTRKCSAQQGARKKVHSG